MDGDADMILSSPSAETSPSSSDIATESTGSFFRDRSTTLGTLMGVSLAAEEQEQGQDHHHHYQSGQDAVDGTGTGTPRAPVHEDEGEGWRWRRRWRRRHWRSAAGGWWRLCRDDVRMPTSLGHFLDMERQLSGAGLLCGGDGAGERDAAAAATARGSGTLPRRRLWLWRRVKRGGGSCGGRRRGPRRPWRGCRCCSRQSAAVEPRNLTCPAAK